jgi:hypothetical protein
MRYATRPRTYRFAALSQGAPDACSGGVHRSGGAVGASAPRDSPTSARIQASASTNASMRPSLPRAMSIGRSGPGNTAAFSQALSARATSRTFERAPSPSRRSPLPRESAVFDGTRRTRKTPASSSPHASKPDRPLSPKPASLRASALSAGPNDQTSARMPSTTLACRCALPIAGSASPAGGRGRLMRSQRALTFALAVVVDDGRASAPLVDLRRTR